MSDSTYPRNPVIDAAERALRMFGDLTRDEVELILPMWKHAAGLTEAERTAILARFPVTR